MRDLGVITGIFELPEDEAFSRLQWFSETQEEPPPQWCTQAFVRNVHDRMRRLLGEWKAIPYGQTMEVRWEEADQL